jgi:hypothetical protein
MEKAALTAKMRAVGWALPEGSHTGAPQMGKVR